jgi:hypothetical protein
MKLRLCLAAALAAVAAGCTRAPTLTDPAGTAPPHPRAESSTAQPDSAGRGAGSMGSGY